MVREYSYKEIQLIGLQPHGKTQQWFQDDLSFGQQNPVKALGTCAWVAQHSSRERKGRRSGCWSIRKGLHCPGGSRKASSESFSKKVTCCKRDLNNCGKTGEGCLAQMTTFWFWSYSSCMRNCAIWGKNLWTYNIENHLVSAHSCQQMRNSFLLVSWEELPQQALQQCRVWLATDTALALQGQDMINFPMKKKNHQQSFTGNQEKDQELGSWMDAAGVVLSPGKHRKWREHRKTLCSSWRSSESKLTREDKIQSKHVLVPASLLS